NDSQISCTIASDTFPPCNPMMTATSDCETFTHTVTVTKQNELCDEDGQSITLYYALTDQGPFEPVATFSYASFGADTVITFVFDERDQNFSGCYAINATDFLGNTSQLSDTTCLEFCPGLEMGNVFSPNDDGINDYFTPLFYRDVVIRDLKIYDRWGRLMHTNTTDIEILWDGEVDSNGNDAADGTYYYYMIYEELGLTENVVRELKGWVSLIR
ncbi:MAG: gliding motility-associated C-terminal domain-containing protein, partial [Bacteroidota bacterium]